MSDCVQIDSSNGGACCIQNPLDVCGHDFGLWKPSRKIPLRVADKLRYVVIHEKAEMEYGVIGEEGHIVFQDIRRDKRSEELLEIWETNSWPHMSEVEPAMVQILSS